MKRGVEWTVLAVACLLCTGCFTDFDETKVHVILENKMTHLDSEEVTLSGGQVDCGVDKELWDAPVLVTAERSVAHLRSAARNLGFSDDVSVNEPGYNFPYAQVRGDFLMKVGDIPDIKDGPGQGYKTVVAQARVRIPHECFGNDLPIMGVRKGQYRQDVSPTIVFVLDNEWKVDHFAH